MIEQIIKDIIGNNNFVSINELEKYINEKNIKVSLNKYLKNSELFKMENGTVFLKKALNEIKAIFFKDFEDYLQAKSIDKKIVLDIIKIYEVLIPEIFYPEWDKMKIDNKIIVFDLLLCFILKNRHINDNLKKYFKGLIELYVILIGFSVIYLKNNEDDLEKTFSYIESIEPFENSLKDMIYEILINPLFVNEEITKKMDDYFYVFSEIDSIIEKNSRIAINYSSKILQKIVGNEIKRFNEIYILSRFNFESFYEYLVFYIDNQRENFYNYNKKLYNDLNI